VKVTLCERASPSGFPVSYNFLISLTCGFAFRYSSGKCFHVVHARHLALTVFVLVFAFFRDRRFRFYLCYYY